MRTKLILIVMSANNLPNLLLIENFLKEVIAPPDDPLMVEAARYTLFSKSKRLRPLLALGAAEALSLSIEETLPIACSLELIHTYSLIHDDLPCMDDDDFRRGQPSLHRKYNEAIAVLTGDYLLTKAFEVISDAPIIDSKKVKLIRLISLRVGGSGMVGGQSLDIQGQPVSESDLKKIHHLKTGALISCCIECAGILADLNPKQVESLNRFGLLIGLAFQITDDILDVTKSMELKNSVLSSDEKNNKTSYISLLGLQGAQAAATESLNQALAILKQIPGSWDELAQMAGAAILRW